MSIISSQKKENSLLSPSSNLIKNVLFLTNLGVDMGDPEFRIGTFLNYLFPLRDRMKNDRSEIQCKFLVGAHIFSVMARHPDFRHRGFSEFLKFDVNRAFASKPFGDGSLSALYTEALGPDELKSVQQEFLLSLGDFEPDLVVAWEFPTGFIRNALPNATVIDLMPGTFMRPPFPKTVAFDPLGIYKNSALRHLLGGQVEPTKTEIKITSSVAKNYANFFQKIEAKSNILSMSRSSDDFDRYVLLPLQVGNYFGFKDNCSFVSQFDMLEHVLQSYDEKTGIIVTQYISDFAKDNIINAKNSDFLKNIYKNFIYSPKFDALNNISQYIAPWVDECFSISSTVGLQSNFFGKKLVSPSTSHLYYVAQADNYMPRENSSALINNRYSLSWNSICQKPNYFLNLAEHFRSISDDNIIDAYRNWPTSKNLQFHYNESNFSRASDLFSRAFGKSIKVDNARIRNMISEIESADVVSFDVFDTLIDRSVFFPTDVFQLMPFNSLVPARRADKDLSAEFYMLARQAAERTVRRSRDTALVAGALESEEITTVEIFTELCQTLADLGWNDPKMTKALVDMECASEFKVLNPTKLGKILYERATALGKPIIIISDFCHSEDFVQDALDRAGYRNYDLFVSSRHGAKKHSGALFRHVSDVRQLEGKRVVHFGDNPHGDIEQAKAFGWRAVQVHLPKVQFQKRLSARGIDFTTLVKSTAYRTAVAMFSNRYVMDDLEISFTPQRPSIVKNATEFGYFCLGPLIVSFARWIREQARYLNVEQIVLFARDCVSPYNVLKVAEEAGLINGISIYYIAASRSATKTLDILRPTDIYHVNLADVSRSSQVKDVLWNRFQIRSEDISDTLWKAVGIMSPSEQFGRISISSLYRLVYLYVCQNWESFSSIVIERRGAYVRYLQSQGIDIDAKTAFVDIGYKGTISRVISTLFSKQSEFLFMATYANELGDDPIEHAHAFLSERSAASNKDPFRRYNLLIESMLNEPVGSAVLVDDKLGVDPSVFREASPGDRHVSAVAEIHQGIKDFACDWYKTFDGFLKEPRFETNKLLEIFSEIMGNPTLDEAAIFDGIEFDNNFAGHDPRYILNSNGDQKISVWREGAVALQFSVDHFQSRSTFLNDGAYCSFQYDDVVNCSDDFKGEILFGSAGRGKTTIHGIDHLYNWIHDEISAFKVESDSIDERVMVIEVVSDAHFEMSDFEIWQNGIKLEHYVTRPHVRSFALNFIARPRYPVVVRNRKFRLAAHPDKDKRRFYWRFLTYRFGLSLE